MQDKIKYYILQIVITVTNKMKVAIAIKLLRSFPGVMCSLPCMQREHMGRDARKSRSRLVGGRVNRQGTDIQGISWVAARQIDLSSHLPNLTSLYRGRNWVQSHIQCSGLNTVSPSEGYVLGAASGAHGPGQGGSKEPSVAGMQLTGQLAVTFS